MFKTTVKQMFLFDLTSAVLMGLGAIFLLIGFIILNTLGPVQMASGNVEVVKWIFFSGFIFCLVNFLFYVFCAFDWYSLTTTGKFAIIAELIYILGVYTKGEEDSEEMVEEKKSLGEEVFKSKSETDSVKSLYGFGHTEDQKWTFSGKKPIVPNTV